MHNFNENELIVYFILVFINLIFGVFAKNFVKNFIYRLLHRIFLILLIITMTYVVVISSEIPDYANYKLIYNSMNIYDAHMEPGYTLLETVGNNMGIPFNVFRGIIIACAFSLIVGTLIRIRTNISLVLSLYAICPYTLDVIQIRNFMALSLVTCAIFCLQDSSIKGKIKYIAIILLAATFHIIALVYLCLLLLGGDFVNKFRRQIIITIFSLSFIFSILLRMNTSAIIGLGLMFFESNSGKSAYYVQGNVRLGYLYFLLNQLLFIAGDYFGLLSPMPKDSETGQMSSKETFLYQNILWINILITCFFPLCMIHMDFSRLFRNMTLLNYIVLGVQLKKDNRTKTGLLSILFILLGMALNFYLNMANTPETPARVFFSMFGASWK